MFGDNNIEYDENGYVYIHCEKYKDLKPFIRKNHTAFIPDNKLIRDELKNDCLDALKNYGETI